MVSLHLYIDNPDTTTYTVKHPAIDRQKTALDKEYILKARHKFTESLVLVTETMSPIEKEDAEPAMNSQKIATDA